VHNDAAISELDACHPMTLPSSLAPGLVTDELALLRHEGRNTVLLILMEVDVEGLLKVLFCR
jgi:hypothetical protein